MTIPVILLCGGRGERLRPLTDTCQKCLLPVGGRPFMDRVIEEYANHGLRNFLLLAGYLGDQVWKAYLEWGTWRGLNVVVHHSPANGTLDALMRIGMPWENILLANGDTLIQTDTNLSNFSGKTLAFKINQQDCGLRKFNVGLLTNVLNTMKDIPHLQTIEKGIFPLLPLKWQNLDKDSSRFIDIGTPENYERAKVIFR